MSSGRFIDHPKAEKRTELYRMYLEEHGVLEALTKALAKLNVMEERPANPMEFVVKELGGAVPGAITAPALEKAYDRAMKELDKLRKEHEELKKEYEATKAILLAKNMDEEMASKSPVLDSTEDVD